MKVIILGARFCSLLRHEFEKTEKQKLEKMRLKLSVDDVDQPEVKTEIKQDVFNIVRTVWFSIFSLFLWFNLITSPLIMMWPDLNENAEAESKSFYYALWLNEFVFILDIVRKFMDKPKKSRA